MEKHLSIVKLLASLSITWFLLGCTNHSEQHNILSDQEIKEGWKLLFDGTSTKGWHLFNMGDIPSAWSVDSGRLVCNPHAKNVKHGDLVTDKAYDNFDLMFEWKISKGGNSGLFINVQESPEYATTWATGPEYQLLDNTNNEEHGKDPMRIAGSLYGMTDIKNNATPKPYGDWNQSRIVQQNGKITFWLNGIVTVQEDLNSDRWKDLLAKSSLGKFPSFGKATNGKLALQDWTNGVSFRDIKIKSL
jgi:hypothetical protein